MAVEYQPADKRATQIMVAAREVFLADGWDHFSMERIAEYLECSRPLVYRYFSCKEEILLALAIESKHRRVRFYERAVAFNGNPREKFIAIGEVESFLFPRDLPIELFVASTAFRAKTSKARQEALKELDVTAVHLGSQIIREAVDRGDLTLPGTMCAEDLLFVAWAMRWGAFNIIRSDTPLEQSGVKEPRKSVDHSLARMLDNYGWKPLRREHDWQDALDRIRAEAFPDEVVNEILNS